MSSSADKPVRHILALSVGEAIGANVFGRICVSLQCNIGDIVDSVPEVRI